MQKFWSIAAGGVLALSAGTAFAAPGGPNAEEIVLTCGSDEITVVVAGGGFSPGHVLDSNTKFIPISIAIEGTFTPTEGDPEMFSETMEKGASPPNKELLTCTFEQTFTEPGGTAVIDGTVIGFLNR